MKEAEGSSDVSGGDDRLARVAGSTKLSVSKSASWAEVEAEDRVRGCMPPGGASQPLVLSLWRMRRRIMASGTREPTFMMLSARIPDSGVSE